MSRSQIDDEQNNEHHRRAYKQNWYIKMITDNKYYDRIPVKWKKVLENDVKLQANKHDKIQIKLKCIKTKWETTVQDIT